MHILIIPSEEYIPNHNPLAGIFQHDQAKILQQHGNKVGVLSFTIRYSFLSLIKALLGKKNNQTERLSFSNTLTLLLTKLIIPKKSSVTFECIDNINVLRCESFFGFKNSSTTLAKLNILEKYYKIALKFYIKKHGKPDIIHAHNMIYAGLFVSKSAIKMNIPIVYTEHSSQYIMGEVNNELKLKLKNTFNASNNLYAVSPALIKQLEQQFSLPVNKIKWLPNVLDDFIEQKSLIVQKQARKKIRFLNIANLIPLKGQVELIRAFSSAFNNKDNVELVIAGGGELKEELLSLVDSLNLNNKIRLIGLIDRQEVVKQLDNCDVFVLPSHYETFGVVLIEALSRGVPLISTYCGGPECIVNESNGILVQPKNEQQLAEALLKMYYEHPNYNKEQLRADVIKQYGKEAFYKRVMEIYTSV